MVLKRIQSQLLINQFNHININKPVHMMDLNYMIIPFEGNINPGYPTGIKLYLQSTKEIDKETDTLDILVPDAKDIIYHFLSISNKYVWRSLEFTVNISAGTNNILRVVEHIMLEDIQNIAYGYFLQQVIGNVKQILPNPLTVSSLTLLYVGNAIEIKYI